MISVSLTALDPSGDAIVFSWWNRVADAPGMVQREAFTFASLRSASSDMFEFNILPTFAPCPIDLVHKEGRADA